MTTTVHGTANPPQAVTATQLLRLVEGDPGKFAVPRTAPSPRWEAQSAHEAAYDADPTLYALMATAAATTEAHRVQFLFQLLRASREGLDANRRLVLDQVVVYLLCLLPADEVLTVFLALRRSRANHRHTTRAIARWVLGHPTAADLVARRRPAVRDALEHALGKSVARAALRAAVAGEKSTALLRFVPSPGKVIELAPHLLGVGPAPASDGDYSLAHCPPAQPVAVRESTVTATNRGEIAASLVQSYRGGFTDLLRAATAEAADKCAASLPRFAGRVGLVLDASASMAGYGDREHCAISQAVALQLVLQRCVSELIAVTTNGVCSEPVRPSGSTDLAAGLIDVARHDPDLILVVTDGFENALHGDLERVAKALPGLGVHAPVLVCNTLFTFTDDLTLRQPAASLPEILFWHQDDFEGLMFQAFARAPGERGLTFMYDTLARQLAAQIEEVRPWLTL